MPTSRTKNERVNIKKSEVWVTKKSSESRSFWFPKKSSKSRSFGLPKNQANQEVWVAKKISKSRSFGFPKNQAKKSEKIATNNIKKIKQGEKMKVNGQAKLIRYTQDPEGTIALAAKLCYSSSEVDDLIEQVDSRDNAKFIRLLTTMNHFSPFEHASFTFSIEGVSRAMLAQITRHRIASFSVRSQRYVSEDEFNYIIPPAIQQLGAEAVDKFESQMSTMLKWYKDWQQDLGGAKESSNEDARFVLPNACETKMIVTMNARELLHFFELRCCNRAQWEIRKIAWDMLAEVVKVAPNVFASAGAGCISGVCPEGKKCCGKMAEVKKRREDINLNNANNI